MSETSTQLRTQATFIDANVSLDSAGRPMLIHEPSQARRQIQHKPKFAEFVCSAGEVYRYAILVTKAVIPKTLWGSTKNFDVVLQSAFVISSSG
ncbi:hypothetical protein BC628DRAFT_1308718 [Trametes gibbosa]|nr:hypothetical protein BC628DRAFT_1308718 [Trametes gibbosa]